MIYSIGHIFVATAIFFFINKKDSKLQSKIEEKKDVDKWKEERKREKESQ